MDVFISVVFKNCYLWVLPKVGSFVLPPPPSPTPPKRFDHEVSRLGANFAADVVYERSTVVFMAEITLVFQKKETFPSY